MKKLLLLLLIAPFLGYGQTKNLSFDLLYNYDLSGVFFEQLDDENLFETTVQPEKIIVLSNGNKQQYFAVSINGSSFFDYDSSLVLIPGTHVKFSSYHGWVSFIEYTSRFSGMDFQDNTPIRELIVLDTSNSNYSVPPNHYLEILSANSSYIVNSRNDYLNDEIVLPQGTTLSFINDNSKTLVGLLIEMPSSSLAHKIPKKTTPTLYPNPTSSLLALNSDKEYDIEVYDMAGNKVMALTGNTIDMSHLSSATYIVKALDKVENEEVNYKVVKN
jgi:hypothetical protein